MVVFRTGYLGRNIAKLISEELRAYRLKTAFGTGLIRLLKGAKERSHDMFSYEPPSSNTHRQAAYARHADVFFVQQQGFANPAFS